MNKFIYSFFLLLFFFNVSIAQKKLNVNVGVGLNVNSSLLSYYDGNITNPSIVREDTKISTSPGFNAFLDYRIREFLYLRAGLQYFKASYEASPILHSSHVLFPLNIGVKWKSFRVYSGIEYERAFYTFLSEHPTHGQLEINEENCNCTLNKNNFNVPISAEIQIFKRFLFGYKYQFIFNEKVDTYFKRDNIKNSYLYLNYIF